MRTRGRGWNFNSRRNESDFNVVIPKLYNHVNGEINLQSEDSTRSLIASEDRMWENSVLSFGLNYQ